MWKDNTVIDLVWGQDIWIVVLEGGNVAWGEFENVYTRPKTGGGGDSHMVLVMWLKIIFKMAAPIGFLFVLCLQIVLVFSGMLYPRNSVSRTVFQKIDGMWNFRIDASESRLQGFSEKWYTRPLKQVQAIHCLRPLFIFIYDKLQNGKE